MKVAIIGTGYVGLTTAGALAHIGHEVTCVDVDADKIGLLRAGGVPIFEPHLQDLIRHNSQRLTFTSDTEAAVRESEVIMIAVGTPSRSDGSADLSFLFSAVHAIARGLEVSGCGRVVVNKSTAPPGTAKRVHEILRTLAPNTRITVASNPEFLRQGSAVQDSLFPDRILVGAQDPGTLRLLEEVYSPLLRQDFDVPAGMARPDGLNSVPFVGVSTVSAELTKYAANSFLAMKISFINEMANLAELLGADVGHVARAMALDPRIGGQHLSAGIGYGGSCFPKDTRALCHIAQEHGYQLEIVEAAIRINDQQWRWVLDRLHEHLDDLRGKRIAILGLAFKPGTDDMRDAPSIPICRALREAGAELRAHDPVAGERAATVMPWLPISADPYEAVVGADAVVIVTEWRQYQDLDWTRVGQVVRTPILLDGRRLLTGRYIPGFDMVVIGKGLDE